MEVSRGASGRVGPQHHPLGFSEKSLSQEGQCQGWSQVISPLSGASESLLFFPACRHIHGMLQ